MDKAQAYAERFDRVLRYIERHLDEPLTVERLSRVAHFSKFHFHRQFSLYTGIGVFGYIRLLRLKHASYRLAYRREERIIDIALDAGFDSPEAFARAFKQMFGHSPSQFRKSPIWQPWRERFRLPTIERRGNMDVKIVEFAETRIAVLEHRGAPEKVDDSALKFIEWRKQSGLSPVKQSRTFGLVYDDPATVEPEEFRFDICGEVSQEVPENPQGVFNSVIQGGRCAVVRHLGSHDRIGDSIYPLYRDWFPKSGEELRDFPLFFHYLNLMPDVAEHELVTDIYLPLK
ncbi:helix-turn-helix transcriptional activator, AraC family [Citrifermentans bemidjiense Bem]|uniref:Helix-turn-helix transcriptional activator, AraC family n=1 Tax=Citrifermentans bemidjiense (strain ATCC BAA-1014 / DSM 16622 / JCM 12645 / Bem) TaxID=404380 RepID=B5E7V6_CITBB|nr:AraC family transcriptional regulator [Citrifermentans bemidjiense]ACH38492.1 helix-turn-helix transcriptional activator, AraC family [Citrifermentans bemidjiense Bem]